MTMKNKIVGIALGMTLMASVQAEVIHKPRWDNSKFTCSSAPIGVCNTLGFDKFIEGSIECGYYKALGALSRYEPYQNSSISSDNTDLVHVTKNNYRNHRPDLTESIIGRLRAYNENYVIVNFIGSANSKIIKTIACE
jgi:hypothetical protein